MAFELMREQASMMAHRNASQKDAVLAAADDLAIPDDDRPEWAAPSFLDGLDGQLGRLMEELLLVFVAFNIYWAHIMLVWLLLVSCGFCG